jgi:hypothetical protein
VTAPTERIVLVVEVPASVTVAEIAAVLREHVSATRVEAYAAAAPPRVCSPHGRADVAWVDGAWRCSACLIQQAAPVGPSNQTIYLEPDTDAR